MYAKAPMPAVTAHTAVTVPQLHARLDADRAAGLAWSDEFYEAGISAVAAAILDASGHPVAALNVSGQVASFEGEVRRAEIGQAAAAAAAEISRHLGWLGADRPGAVAPALKVVA